MSIGGPSALGTLLIQRLDAVLGLHTSQQSNLASGARPDAVSQAQQAERALPGQNSLVRSTRGAVDQAQEHRIQGRDQKTDNSLRPGLNATQTPSTPSTPTTLGRTAQFILQLLESYPGPAPAIQGRQALLPFLPSASTVAGNPPPEQNQTAPNTAGQGPAQPSSPTATGTGHWLQAAIAALSSRQQHALLASSAQQAPTLADFFSQSLQQQLQHSGLFYESHLAQWVQGKAQIEELQQAPQNRLPTAVPNPGSEAAPEQARALNQDTLALLVRQQLEALGTQSLHWHGPAWEGCDMQWAVQRQPDHDPSAPPESWSSQLTLNLPLLGQVHIKLDLLDQRLLLRIESQAEQTAYLHESREILQERLSERGLHVSQLTIQASPDTP